jgi:hypothetical protein
MTTVAVGVLCMALGIWLGRYWANVAILLLLDKLELGKRSNVPGEAALPARKDA